MNYLGLLLLLFATWALILVAEARRNIVRAHRTRHPASGVSIFPGIPVMPFSFLLAAWLLEHLIPNIGLLLVGGLHVCFIAFALASIAFSRLSSR